MEKINKEIKYFIYWLHWQKDIKISQTIGSKSKRSMIFIELIWKNGYHIEKKRTLDYMYNYWLENIRK